ncbi:MAG: enoyl-CoA hydratase/isomerase family protein [Maricaulaceae bacterium]|jgi:enoyl-CoA hydratase
MTEEPSVIARVVGDVGRLTLNRPKALNALDAPMIGALTEALLEWRDQPRVRAVVVDGAGERAFCAGGDIRLLWESGRAGDDRAESFWRAEYRLNQLIARYRKPYVALIDGVTMGGGVGLSVYGGFRVAGDRTLFAMPETGIGYFPDVGGRWFLPRLPGAAGTWMGLTGARLKAADALALGLATHYVPTDRTADLIAALEAAELDEDGGAVEATIAAFAADPGEAPFAAAREVIDRTFASARVEDIFAALEREGTDWAAAQLDALKTKSPTSLVATRRALAEGARMTLEEALRADLALSVAFLDPGSDFYEGVRAVIVDKDGAPAWNPERLEDVDPERIDGLFAPERDRPIDFIE